MRLEYVFLSRAPFFGSTLTNDSPKTQNVVVLSFDQLRWDLRFIPTEKIEHTKFIKNSGPEPSSKPSNKFIRWWQGDDDNNNKKESQFSSFFKFFSQNTILTLLHIPFQITFNQLLHSPFIITPHSYQPLPLSHFFLKKSR